MAADWRAAKSRVTSCGDDIERKQCQKLRLGAKPALGVQQLAKKHAHAAHMEWFSSVLCTCHAVGGYNCLCPRVADYRLSLCTFLGMLETCPTRFDHGDHVLSVGGCQLNIGNTSGADYIIYMCASSLKNGLST